MDGPWRGCELTNDLLASAPDPDLDDTRWPVVEIPSQWATESQFRDCTGPVVYRKRFEADPPETDQRTWLNLQGVIGDAEVWLDGEYLGETKEYFTPSLFDISTYLSTEDTNHLVAIEVTDATESHEPRKRSLTGTLNGGFLSAPGSPAGIWKSVSLQQTGPVAILHSRLLCTKANLDEAELTFRLVLDSSQSGKIQVDTSILGPDGSTSGGGAELFTVASGENQIEWTTTIQNPSLWWPAEMGDQPLYDIALAVRMAPEPEERSADPAKLGDDPTAFLEHDVSDRFQWRTGLRTIEVNKLIWSVNGKRLFIKGVTLGPLDPLLANVASERLSGDVGSALDAGLNMIRVHGHISYPDLYKAADEAGLLIWQDLPLAGEYAAAARKPAQSMARAAVDAIGHHPSVSVWCAHEEPNGPPLPEPQGDLDPLAVIGKHLTKHILPSWSRSVLDPLVRRQLRHTDPSRAVITRSGSLPGIADLDHSDPHLWLGWHSGKITDLPKVLRRWPRMGLFLGGFGSQSVAIKDWDAEQPTWPGAQKGAFRRYLPRKAYADGTTWAHASRAYQADLLRQHIETIRRLKYNPSGGFCITALVDSQPAGGFGILDYERHPKPAYSALTDASRPVAVFADRTPTVVTPGQQISIAVHAVNDLRRVLGSVTIRAKVTVGDWEYSKNWKGSIPEDTCSYVGSLNFTVPAIHGALITDVELDESSYVATNRYTSAVIPGAEANLGNASASQK